MKKTLSLILSFLVVGSIFLTACQPASQPVSENPVAAEPTKAEAPSVGEPAQEEPAVPAPTEAASTEAQTGGKTLIVVNGPTDVTSLDPSILEDARSRQIANEIYGGFNYVDEVTSEAVPNIAKSWDISSDGTVYTFHLRDDIPWVKYNSTTGEVEKTDHMVTAQDFRYAMLRTLTPKIASPFAYVNAWKIAGADAFNKGTTTDENSVGVKIIDDYTLEVTFLQAAAYDAAIAGMSMNNAEPSWVIDQYSDQWTEPQNIVSYGPYALSEWTHDDHITLVKNPFFPGTEGVPQAKIDTVKLLFLDNGPALAAYEAGTVDWTVVASTDIDRVKSDPVLADQFKTSPRACTGYYMLNTMSSFTDDVRIRKALSYSIDRESIVNYVTKGGETPASMMINPALAGAPDPAKYQGPTFDQEFAKAQLQDYLDETGKTVDDIDITLGFYTSDLNQQIAQAVQQMWKQNLGIDVKLQSIETKVYYAQVDTPDMPQVAALAWCPDYFDADNFISGAFHSGGMNNEVDQNGNPSGGIRWKNPEFDQLVDEAASELDNSKRQELYAQAESIIGTQDVVFIPLYYYSFASLTKPYVTRTYSVSGVEAYEKWDVSK